MTAFVMQGGHALFGQIPISGAKNATLPLLAASFLTHEPFSLLHVPKLIDTTTMLALLRAMGAHIKEDWQKKLLTISTAHVKTLEHNPSYAPLFQKIRASILLLGPLLARFSKAYAMIPGGCAIGKRPIDIHLECLKKMGATIQVNQHLIQASAPKGLKGTHIRLPFPSVGGTENLLMAATAAKGETILENVALEPEIDDLITCLKSMGATISRPTANTLLIKGEKPLSGTTHHIMPDRIEAGTYCIAAAMTKGEITLKGAKSQHMTTFLSALKQAGASITEGDNTLTVKQQTELKALSITTGPFPAFPTDLQAQFLAMMTLAKGTSCIKETVFENRFLHVQQLQRLGASITMEGRKAYVKGGTPLTGNKVEATDLRASVCLVLAGLCAKGQTTITHIHHLDRGYEDLEHKLSALGANIKRVSTPV